MAKASPAAKGKTKDVRSRQSASGGAATNRDFVEAALALNAHGKSVGRGYKAIADALDRLTAAVTKATDAPLVGATDAPRLDIGATGPIL